MRVELAPSDFTRLTLVGVAAAAGVAAWRYRQDAETSNAAYAAYRDLANRQAEQLAAANQAILDLNELLDAHSEIEIAAAIGDLLVRSLNGGAHRLVVLAKDPAGTVVDTHLGAGTDGTPWYWHTAVGCHCGCGVTLQTNGWESTYEDADLAALTSIQTLSGENHAEQAGPPETQMGDLDPA